MATITAAQAAQAINRYAERRGWRDRITSDEVVAQAGASADEYRIDSENHYWIVEYNMLLDAARVRLVEPEHDEALDLDDVDEPVEIVEPAHEPDLDVVAAVRSLAAASARRLTPDEVRAARAGEIADHQEDMQRAAPVLYYRCQRCGTITESIVQVDSLYCTCAYRAIEVVELTPEQAQQERERRYDDLPERDMDGSHFSVEPTPEQEQAYRLEQVRWSRLTPAEQHAELLEESIELNRHMRDLRGR